MRSAGSVAACARAGSSSGERRRGPGIPSRTRRSSQAGAIPTSPALARAVTGLAGSFPRSTAITHHPRASASAEQRPLAEVAVQDMCLPGASSGENKHTGRATTAGRAAPGTSPLTPSPERIRSHCRALAAIRLRAVPSFSLRASALCVASRVSRAPVAGVGTVTCLRHPAASRTRAGADAWPLGDRCGFPGRRPISEECGPVAEELSNGGPLENAGFDIAGLPQAEGTSVRGYATRAKHEAEATGGRRAQHARFG